MARRRIGLGFFSEGLNFEDPPDEAQNYSILLFLLQSKALKWF
jgi:hypothetical protein